MKFSRPIKVLEIGGAARSYWWKKRLYDYTNGDLVSKVSETVDFFVGNGVIQKKAGSVDVAIVSHVLGEVVNSETRLNLLASMARVTQEDGVLISFEDFDLAAETHEVLGKRQYFHKLRLGKPILAELDTCGWQPITIDALPKNAVLGDIELPFLLATKRNEGLAAFPLESVFVFQPLFSE